MSAGFSVGVIADLSGAGAGGVGGPVVPVGRDEFEDVFRRLEPRVVLDLPFCREIALTDWEALHPDALAARVPALAELLERRDAGPGEIPVTEPTREVETTESELLDAIVDGRPLEGRPRVVRRSADPEFDRMIAEIVGDAADRTDYAAQERWRAALDREIAARARAILLHPAFQGLEAAWRSLRALAFGAETGEALRIGVLDASRAALREDAGRDSGDSWLARRLVDEARGTPGGEPFGLLVVDHAFGGGDDDLRVLAHLARVAERAEAPCVAALAPAFWRDDELDWGGIESLAARVRGLEGARRLGLVCPRVMLRAPYGSDSEPVDRFSFGGERDDAAEVLWGSPAWVIAEVAIEAVATTGQAAAIGKHAQRSDRAFHVYRTDGEAASIGPTDRLLRDAEIERLAELGIVPLAAVRGRDVLHVASFRSLTGDPLFPG